MINDFIKWSGISSYFARFWMAGMKFPGGYLRVSTPQTSFGGLFGGSQLMTIRAPWILANEMLSYCEKFGYEPNTKWNNSLVLFMNVSILVKKIPDNLIKL